ncbi:MAG TPA: hypothetical protein VMV47_08295 [Bacteroidales bacterium]|nr:hypothetical protein [Bacteroidales bacterium]
MKKFGVYLFLFVLIFSSCEKKVEPALTTTAASSITPNTATSGGNITSDGGSTVTARGVCWSTSADPTIADSKTSDGTGPGTFISSITGLTGGTSYYVKAYATNSTGTAYGNEISFTTTAVNMLRIENLMTTNAANCVVGGVDFGTVAAGAISEYKVVPGGVSVLSGGFTSGSTVTLPSNPATNRKFTLTINANASLSIAEDL